MKLHGLLKLTLLFLLSFTLTGCGIYAVNAKRRVEPTMAEKAKGAYSGAVLGAAKAVIMNSKAGLMGAAGAVIGSQVAVHPEVISARLRSRGANVLRNGEELEVVINRVSHLSQKSH